MSMKKIVIKVDATYGVKVKVGNTVSQGQEIGKNPFASEVVTCPVSGVVRDIRFEPANHEFVIVLTS